MSEVAKAFEKVLSFDFGEHKQVNPALEQEARELRYKKLDYNLLKAE